MRAEMDKYFMGLDVGTQGVRCMVVDARGETVAAKSVAFARMNSASAPGAYEQLPADWQAASEQAIRACTSQLPDSARVASISIDGTSGTIVPLDARFCPLTPALMYNDPRAKAEAARVHAEMGAHEQKLGLTFGASFSLPRILWIKAHQPQIYEKTRVFAHQADYVVGLLCGEYCVSDYSNALKTGYDLIERRWPDAIARMGLDLGKFPRVLGPGEPIAPVTRAAAERLGLSEKTMVVGGSTDGYASALAAGAVSAGQWASIIGTTFVLKGVTDQLVIDPSGASYSHLLPSGEWMLGGASNLGGRCLNACAQGRAFAEMDRAAEPLVPTGARCYPLSGRGERFPFVDPDAEAFYRGDILSGKLYPALMEGVALGERLAFARMQKLGAPVGQTIWTAGGACRSDLWLRIRASVLNRQLVVPGSIDAAMGSALVAASGAFGSLARAAGAMLRREKTVDPVDGWVRAYDEVYKAFEEDCRKNYKI